MTRMHLPGLACALGLLITSAPLHAQNTLKVETYVSDTSTGNVTSVLIEGPRNIFLVDAQLTNTEAGKLIAMIKATGKNLQVVFISSAEPAHYLGLTALKAAYPHLKIWATPSVIQGITTTSEAAIKDLKARYGASEIPDKAIIPLTVPGNSLYLDGQTVEVDGPHQGAVAGCSYAFVPTTKTLVAGDLVFNDVHLIMAGSTAASRKDWLDELERLQKLGASAVIAGHKDPAANDDPACIEWTERYIKTWDKAVKMAHDPDELIGIIEDQFPDAKGSEGPLQAGANAAYPQKN